MVGQPPIQPWFRLTYGEFYLAGRIDSRGKVCLGIGSPYRKASVVVINPDDVPKIIQWMMQACTNRTPPPPPGGEPTNVLQFRSRRKRF